MKQSELDSLLAAIKLGRFQWFELASAAGYHTNTVDRLFSKFKKLGIFEKVAGKLQVTEKGKIIAAILVGKMRKKANKRKKK